MFKFDNTHIFTGYLKQKLSSINIPACKIYTKEFADYKREYGKEDPRVVESINSVVYSEDDRRIATRVNYLKNNRIYNYFWDGFNSDGSYKGHNKLTWKNISSLYYDSEKSIPGFTKKLYSPGHFYDTTTHEYLGDYLRFLRDYHGVNLMSLYNCFSNSICNNIYFKPRYGANEVFKHEVIFNSQDSMYKIYAVPVKLFANYTIAIDSHQGVELFCGFYNTNLDVTDRAVDLIATTYEKHNKTIFNQPFLYSLLDVENWKYDREIIESENKLNTKIASRWDIINREQDLKLFIKVPVSCHSSIVVLEGDYRNFNNTKYTVQKDNNKTKWHYEYNHSVLNFGDKLDLNTNSFMPIGKLQLLEFNNGESYPFADRLVEYLSDSAITSIETIPDNIKRVQRTMKQNDNYFKIEGLWENKIQKIIYDYMMCSGPIRLDESKTNIKDYRLGDFKYIGQKSRSTQYDVLGYVDKEAEKLYAGWKLIKASPEKGVDAKVVMLDSIQNIDIYDGLYKED